MADTASFRGPVWPWFTAWSLQGAGVVLVETLGVDGDAARFALSGLVAALPLIGLYWFLGRCSRLQSEEAA